MVGGWSVRLGGMEWNRYAIFFGLVLAAFVAALILTRRLEDPKAREVDELLRDLIVQSPFRAWVRIWWR